MTWVRRNIWRLAGVLIVLFLAASIAAPFMSADRFRDQIRTALETALGRPVQTGEARFQLLTGAGFSVSEVVIADDPAFGQEPFAWVETLEAYPEFYSLFTGKLRFSSIRLSSPVVNLVKVEGAEGARWNFEPLATARRMAGLPKISVRGGRVNFKFGHTKSVFYLTNADIDISAPHSKDLNWQLDFTGEPARTDRAMVGGAGHGMGFFRGNGVFRRGNQTDANADQIQLNLVLERSPLGDLIALIYGRDIGVHGVVSANASIKGPLSGLDFNGRVRFEQMHRWDQMPLWEFGIPVSFRGRMNLPAQTLELESASEAKEAVPVAIRYQVSNFLSRPEWNVNVRWERMAAGPLAPLARHMGLPLPEPMDISGELEGLIDYSSQEGLRGRCVFRDTTLQLPGSAPMRFEEAEVLLDSESARLNSAGLRLASSDARVEGSWSWRTGDVETSIAGDGIELGTLPFESLNLPRPAPINGGVWSGGLRYRRSGVESGEWSGLVNVKSATAVIDGLDGEIKIDSADFRFQAARWSAERIQAEAGNIKMAASLRVDPTRPLRFQLDIPELDAAELEALLAPSLRRGNFLRRALNFGRVTVPPWLANRKASGVMRIGSLTLGPVELQRLRSSVAWDGTQLRLAALGAEVGEGAISAEITADLRGADPKYRALFAIEGVQMNGAAFSVDGSLDSFGSGRAVLANLRSDGSFTARSFESDAMMGFGAVSGCYRAEWNSRAPMLSFTELQATLGNEMYIGRGVTQADGKLALQLTNGNRQLRLVGSLPSLRAEP